ncbi:MAG TPA: HypC/HybG/HupF family hydrogenase formation chaperone [Chloroflexota bacterium]
MCLAIPGRIVEMLDDDLQLAKAEVSGVRRTINVSLVAEEDGGLALGDWVLIHVGFAMSKIDEAEAQRTLGALEQIGEAYRQELQDLTVSRIE